MFADAGHVDADAEAAVVALGDSITDGHGATTNGNDRWTDVLAAEERKFRELVSRGRSLLRRLYPSGRLTEEDYEFLRDTHGLPRELITDLLGSP